MAATIEELIQPYGPQLPLDELVEQANRWYHAEEAKTYDGAHDEIRVQLPPLWKEMLELAKQRLGQRTVNVFDFGCGTGFELEQLLQSFGPEELGQVFCYDLSPEMLGKCKQKFSQTQAKLNWTTELEKVQALGLKFDLLLTNSLMHHLPNPRQMLEKLKPLLTEDAIWINGHEPSSRFYTNAQCRETYGEFLAEQRWQKYLSPTRYFRAACRAVGLATTPELETSRKAMAAGVFKKRPPARLISRLVDFHVPGSCAEAEAGKGFDVRRLEREFSADWSLQWTRSYAFMGAYYEGRLPQAWKAKAAQLQQQFPDDGANVCAVWQRK